MVKFLIIRFSSIGDIVLTTPVVRAIKSQIKNAEIHYLTKVHFRFLLETNPYIDKIHTLNDNFNELIKELQIEQFDHIIDLHHNLRSGKVKRALSIPAFTLDKLNIQKWLLVNLKLNRMPNKHIVDRYLDTLNVFDIKNDNEGLDYFIPEKDQFEFSNQPFEKNKYIAFVLGATYFTKQIPIDLASNIINKYELPTILLGGKDDVEKSEELMRLLKNKAYNFCGKINLNQSASLIEHAKIVVSSDTGLMHIAAAFNKPVVSLWGNTVPEFGMSVYKPHTDSKIFEITDLKCRPCSKIGFNKCPKKHFKCMNLQNSDAISKYIRTIYFES
ncbi:MAG: glycosyltransferase family 9 protein [Bacteroidales bacterium]|nr:glycosyltransferase family 9 protein [Bacteroidales bacterium]